MAAILKIRGITKTYPGVRALQDVSFEVEQGVIHAIMGENGAGKSTLMQIIAGAQRPDSGTIEFGGRELHFANPAQAQAGHRHRLPGTEPLAESFNRGEYLSRDGTQNSWGIC